MRFRLGELELTAPVALSGGFPQKLAEMAIPFGTDLIEDLGAGLGTFSWSGVVSRAEGGIERLMAIKALKDAGETTLGIGNESWRVVIGDLSWSLTRAGHVQYSMTLREVAEVAIVTRTTPELAAVDNTTDYLVQLWPKRQALTWRGVARRVQEMMERAVTAVTRLRALVGDAVSFVTLPVATCKAATALIEVLWTQLQGIAEDCREQIAAGGLWHDDDQTVREALRLARAGTREVGVLRAAVELTPKAAGEHVVQAGDTLMRIAVEHYGDRGGWDRIALANSVFRVEDLQVGMVLVIPERT